jgi:hypothetical protein
MIWLSVKSSELKSVLIEASNFVGSETGQKQSIKLLQIMVSNTTQHPPPPPPPYHTFSILYFGFGKGGGVGEVNQREG